LVFRKLDTFCYLDSCKLHRATCSRFDRILALCDRQTDRQTDGIAVASTAFAMRVLRRAVKVDSLLSKKVRNHLFKPPSSIYPHKLSADEGIIIILCEIGRRLSVVSGDPRETSFLFQCLSILIQRFNSVLIHESFCSNDEDLDL